MKKLNKYSKRMQSGFSLVELMMVIGVLAILIGLMLPALGHARDTALETQCLVQLRDNMTMLHMYAGENQDYWPMSFQRRNGSDGWEGPGGFVVSDEGYLGAQVGYWPYVMRESYKNNSIHPSLMCPANGDTEEYINEIADQLGGDPSQLVFPQDRILSAAFFARPTFCKQDQPSWIPSAATVGKIASVRYPSSKAAVFDSVPFHDERWVSVYQPNPPPPFGLPVAAVDSSVSIRTTEEVRLPVLISGPFDDQLAELRRKISMFQLTKDGWLGRDW